MLWGLIYTGAFLAAFAGSAVFKMTYDPLGGLTKVDWSDAVGTVYTDSPTRATGCRTTTNRPASITGRSTNISTLACGKAAG